MDIRELEQFNLDDAVKFHSRLNPRLWGRDEHLLPEVQQNLLAIAEDFREFLGVPDLRVKDITLSGSNAAYSYTDHSDIDLHLVIDMPEDPVYRELFDAKKYQYNDQHDYRVGPYQVELYVQDSSQPHYSQGIYSVKDRAWQQVPRRRRAEVNDDSVRHKYEDLGARAEAAIDSGDLDRMRAVMDRIKTVRQSGLAKNGEFGAENLAFKLLRNTGVIKRLTQARNQAQDRLLSISERKKKRGKKRVRYGFGGWWYPGFHDDSGATGDSAGGDGGGGESMREDNTGMAQGSEIGDAGAQSTWDGVSKSTQTFLSEGPPTEILKDFVQRTVRRLRLKNPPRVVFHKNSTWAKHNHSFGQYDPATNRLHVSLPGRHVMDIMRTIAHELTHAKQNERYQLPDTAGETGSDWENSANAMAGIIMRDMAQANPELFESIGRSTDLTEGWLNRAAAAAAIGAALSMTSAKAQDQEPEQQPSATVGQVLNTALRLYGISRIREPQARAEVEQEFRNYLRAQQGDPNAQNISKIYQWQQQQKLDEAASGYIPTKRQARDPRFSMALTVDIKPGQVGKEANKLGLKTDSQGRPTLLANNLANALKEFKETGRIAEDCWSGYRQQGMKKKGNRMVPNCVPVEEDQELMEVEMSPSAFQRFLKSPAAEGIRAGFEAELIFRNTQSDAEGGGEAEPDYEADERAYSIQDIIDFFQGGDNPIGRRAADRLSQELTEQFSDWAREQFANDYFDLDRFMSWAEDNVWPDNEDDYREDARTNLDDDATDEDVEREAVTLFRDDVERDWDRSGAWYDMASEELFDDYWGDLDQSDWLDQQGLRYMSNVAEEYGLDWPYWTDGSGSGGERDWNDISNSLATVTGMPVRVSGGYHGAARREGQYIIEPDSSLDSDDSDDYGLEIVSPPMPLPEAIEQLNRIIDWANGPGDAYTNSSTGLHMGVSLPYKGGDVDPIKLILFMGDKNLLETFGRESNTYARSAYERLESKIRGMRNAGPQQIAGVMDLMKKNLIELADREMKRGVLGDKYVSVNPHDGYIEFRGPGGDYLSKESEIDGVLENTMLRLAYAMSIAGDNAAYRKEYAKKLYKVLTKDDPANPFMRLFADYSAGTLTGEELKRQWADTVLQAERGDVELVPPYTSPTGEYEVYDRDSGISGDRDSYTVIDTFRAPNDGEAMARAQENWSGRGVNFGVRAKVAEPEDQKPKSRRAELAKRVTRSTRDVGEQLWRVNHHSSVQYVIARSQAEAVTKAVKKDRAFNSPETRARIATDQEKAQYQLDQERQALTKLPNTSSDPNANWAIARKNNNQIVIPFTRNTRQEAEEYFRDWTQSRVSGPDPYKLVELIPPTANDQEKTYRVTWTERRSDGEFQDSLNVQARGPQNAMQRVRDALDAQGREVVRIQADEVASPARTGEPIPGSTLDLARQRAQQAQGEWTGHWIVRDSQGRELTRFHGIGNAQSDANRHAAAWLGRNRPDLVGQDVDVVPEMR